jgi:metal-responsive CopG/Arc/MetJ family transcriptional regulator
MKTAISIPDDLFVSADSLASRLGVSRSELYATAIAEFLAKHSSRKITSRLDSVYAAEPSSLDPAIKTLQAKSLPRDKW